MKKLYTIIAILLFGLTTWAQVPQKMSYQAVVRNTSNALIVNQSVGINIQILLNGSIPVYSEIHAATTNANGLVTLAIGTGSIISGSFSSIDWSNGTYFIQCSIDPTGGTNYTISSMSQLLSVPFALHALTADNTFSGNYNDLSNKPTFASVATTGKYSDLSDKPTYATVATSGNYNDLTNKPTINGSETKLSAGSNVSISGNGTTATPYVINATTSGFTHYIGELYGGGIVISLWKENGVEHGLIASLTNLNSSVYSNVIGIVGNYEAEGPTNGLVNTNAIVLQSGHTTSAAKVCVNYSVDGYDDWYLPAILELRQMYNVAFIVNTVLGDADGFLFRDYWSSSEVGTDKAFVLNFQMGNTGIISKSQSYSVRPVRKF